MFVLTEPATLDNKGLLLIQPLGTNISKGKQCFHIKENQNLSLYLPNQMEETNHISAILENILSLNYLPPIPLAQLSSFFYFDKTIV